MPPREIAGPAGRLEAILEEPAAAGSIGRDGRVSPGHPGGLRAAVVFAHPLTSRGGTMHTKVVYQAAKALSRIGCAVLRFNFRGAGASEGTFSNGPGEQDDFRAALDYMAAQYPGALRNSCQEQGGSWEFMDRVIDRLRTYDTRWGYNCKRGNCNDPSLDVASYFYSNGDNINGRAEVYIFDIDEPHQFIRVRTGSHWLGSTLGSSHSNQSYPFALDVI